MENNELDQNTEMNQNDNFDDSQYEKFLLDSFEYSTLYTEKYKRRKPFQPKNPKKITAFIPGKIEKVYVKNNSKVKAGDILIILEAMKMKNQIMASEDGKIKKIYVKQGESVLKDTLLLEFY